MAMRDLMFKCEECDVYMKHFFDTVYTCDQCDKVIFRRSILDKG